MKKSNQYKQKIFFWSGFLVLVFSAVLIWFYIFPNSYFSRFLTERFPFPAVIIWDKYPHIITFSETEENLRAVRNFYEKQNFSDLGIRIDFSTEAGKKRLAIKEKEVLNKLVEDKIIELLARKNGLEVSQDYLDQKVARHLEEYGGTNAVYEKINNIYGWDIEKFKKKIVKPDLYKEKTREIFQKETENESAAARASIEKAQEFLRLNNNDFVQAVQLYSEKNSPEKGYLGWFKKTDLDPRVAEAVFALPIGGVSDIIETDLGFHIVKLENKNTEKEMVEISQILKAKPLFPDWLENKMKNMSVWVLNRNYFWDKKNLLVDFSNPDLREFEKEYKKEN